MPSIQIHIAIAKEYCEKWKKEYTFDFYKGVVAPDIFKENNNHYSRARDKNNLLEYLHNKTDLVWYLQDNIINNDYDTGYFLHLVTDYLFFNYYFKDDYIKQFDFECFYKNLYYSYGIIEREVVQKYKVEFILYKEKIEEKIRQALENKKIDDFVYDNVLPMDKLDNFIDRIASIDLKKYILKIKKTGKNVLPDELEE